MENVKLRPLRTGAFAVHTSQARCPLWVRVLEHLVQYLRNDLPGESVCPAPHKLDQMNGESATLRGEGARDEATVQRGGDHPDSARGETAPTKSTFQNR